MNDEYAIELLTVEVGTGRSVLQTGKRLPELAVTVMQKVMNAYVLQIQVEAGKLYMAETAQIALWKDVYDHYEEYINSPFCEKHDPVGYSIIVSFGYLLSMLDVMNQAEWQLSWDEVIQQAQDYMQNGGIQ